MQYKPMWLNSLYAVAVHVLTRGQYCKRELCSSDKLLMVKVNGPRPDNILLMVHEVFEDLIAEFFRGTHYEYQLPCRDCVRLVSTHLYIWSHGQWGQGVRLPCGDCVWLVSTHLYIWSHGQWGQGVNLPCGDCVRLVSMLTSGNM